MSRFDPPELHRRSVAEGYAIWSKNYDQMLTYNLDGPILTSFLPFLSSVAGCVIDLGCGTGRTGRWLKENASVGEIDGVDVSGEMIECARPKGLYRTLVVGDMTQTGLEAGTYDLAVNVLSACHVADLGSLYAEAHRLVRPGGSFVMIDFHPHMMLNGKGTCFPDVDGNMVAIENTIHLLRDHTRVAREVGFRFEAFDESLVTQAWLDQGLALTEYRDHPIGFGFAWLKRADGGAL
jgi:SAM-dependent methyltransferase